MKRVIGKATLMVMGVFAYLILSITFYQNAMAADCEVEQVCFVQSLTASSDKTLRQTGGLIIITSIHGYEAGVADLAASVVTSVEGYNADGWLQTFANIATVYEECPIYKLDNQQVVNAWLAYTATKSQMKTSVATMLFLNEACEEQLTFIIEFTGTPSSKGQKNETGT